jgi:hypothetical protein
VQFAERKSHIQEALAKGLENLAAKHPERVAEMISRIQEIKKTSRTGRCSHPIPHGDVGKSGRGGQIRTDDIRVPNAALYQAELRPVHGRTLGESRE